MGTRRCALKSAKKRSYNKKWCKMDGHYYTQLKNIVWNLVVYGSEEIAKHQVLLIVKEESSALHSHSFDNVLQIIHCIHLVDTPTLVRATRAKLAKDKHHNIESRVSKGNHEPLNHIDSNDVTFQDDN